MPKTLPRNGTSPTIWMMKLCTMATNAKLETISKNKLEKN
jgi:hypothetical protein